MKKLVVFAVLALAVLLPALQSSAGEVSSVVEVLVKSSPWNLTWVYTEFGKSSGVYTIVFKLNDGGHLVGQVTEHSYIFAPPPQFRSARTGDLSFLKVEKNRVEFTLPNGARIELTFKEKWKFEGTSRLPSAVSDVTMVPRNP